MWNQRKFGITRGQAGVGELYGNRSQSQGLGVSRERSHSQASSLYHNPPAASSSGMGGGPILSQSQHTQEYSPPLMREASQSQSMRWNTASTPRQSTAVTSDVALSTQIDAVEEALCTMRAAVRSALERVRVLEGNAVRREGALKELDAEMRHRFEALSSRVLNTARQAVMEREVRSPSPRCGGVEVKMEVGLPPMVQEEEEEEEEEGVRGASESSGAMWCSPPNDTQLQKRLDALSRQGSSPECGLQFDASDSASDGAYEDLFME